MTCVTVGLSGLVAQDTDSDESAVVDGLTTCTTVDDVDIVEDAFEAFEEVSESRLISGSPSVKLFSKAHNSPNMASKSWSNVSSRFIRL